MATDTEASWEVAGALITAGYPSFTEDRSDGSYVVLPLAVARDVLRDLTYFRQGTQPGSVRLIVRQENQTVAVVENYDGPVPRKGDYIFHPARDDDGTGDMSTGNGGIAGCVKLVTFGIYARPKNGEPHFVARRPDARVVEVTI